MAIAPQQRFWTFRIRRRDWRIPISRRNGRNNCKGRPFTLAYNQLSFGFCFFVCLLHSRKRDRRKQQSENDELSLASSLLFDVLSLIDVRASPPVCCTYLLVRVAWKRTPCCTARAYSIGKGTIPSTYSWLTAVFAIFRTSTVLGAVRDDGISYRIV